VGIGTYTSSGTTLSRDTVLASSNGGSLVNFSAGTKDVFCDYPAGKAVTTDTLAYPPAIGATTPAAGTFTTLTSTGQANIGTGFARYLIATGSASGSPGMYATAGSLTFSGGGGAGVNFYSNLFTELQLNITRTASAVNYANVTGAATGSGPIYSVAGSDTNIDLNLTPKGTGSVISNVNGGTFSIARDSASNAVKLTAPNQNLYVQSSGGGAILFNTSDGTTLNQMRITSTASVVNYLNVTGSATGSGVTLSAQGSDTNIDINLVPKGTGSTVYTGGVTVNGTVTAQNATLKGTGTNLLVQSSSLTTTWTQSNVSLTGGQADPFGGTTAATLNSGTAVTTQHSFYQATSYASNVFTLSIYAKAGTANYVGIYLSGPNSGVIFNLATGSFSTNIGVAPTSYAITAVSGAAGWYRCSITVSGAQTFSQFFISEDGTNLTFTGTSKTITVAAPQLEIGSTLNTYIPTTTSQIYGTPTLSFSGVSTIGLESNGSLFVQPAGTGALQAQATTSSAVGGNARGTYAVDWQMLRNSASEVASGIYSIIGGGQRNTASGAYAQSLGGYSNTSSGFESIIVGGQSNGGSGQISFIGGGVSNTASGYGSVITGGTSNISAGIYSFIGTGQANSGTSGTVVTTQSGTMNGTTAVTLSGSNANIKVGQYISSTSIGTDTYVAAISGTSLTLSKVATGSSTSTLSFFTPHGVVVGGGNNQATGSYSFIGGGGDAGTAANRNVASGDWGTVGGGRKNVASGIGSTVAGGGTDGANTFSNTASGITSFVGGGWNNTAGGTLSVVVGGTSNNASGTSAFIGGGDAHTGSGLTSAIMGGRRGTTRGLTGYHVFPACYDPLGSTTGAAQSALLVLAKQTTDATATVITSDGNSASGTNQIILPNNSAYYFKGSVIANVTGAANGASWSFEGAIMRGANAASTVLIGTPAINRVASTSGASAWTIALTADTTNGGLAVTVTGAASTTIRWVSSISTTEVTF
jgi:hypothetical protein